MEVILHPFDEEWNTGSILHVCGGDPPINFGLWEKSILHVCGGDPLRLGRQEVVLKVFSTYVEVILIATGSIKNGLSILHVCGGDPCWY